MRNYVLAVAVALGVTLPIVPAYADVKAGVKAWAQGKFEDAVAHWRIPAQTGDADAQFNLGQAYRFGRGVPMDLNMAENWYRRAARLGHVRAEENLGLVLFQKGNYDEAFPLLEKAAKREDPRAQYVLGTALFNGDLIEKDWARAYAARVRKRPRSRNNASDRDEQICLRGNARRRDQSGRKTKASSPRSDRRSGTRASNAACNATCAART